MNQPTTPHGGPSGAGEGPATSESASDRRIRQMVADPAGYFRRARVEARSEARGYVLRRLRQARVA